MDNIEIDLNSEQAKAVRHDEGPLLILAGAGSGKTRTIVHRMAWLVHQRNVQPWRLVAVTFTNKAAQEMLERAVSIGGAVMRDCQIRTFHSFGLHLLRQYSSYLGLPSHFSIWDESDQRSCIQTLLNARFSVRYNKTQLRYLTSQISSFKDELVSPAELAEKIDLEAMEIKITK